MADTRLVTGDLVLCTVGSYDPWPAVVVPQRILSTSVWKAKENNNQVAVAFFNDSTYYWSKPKQLTKLSKEKIDSWIKKPPKRSSKELKIAYQYAADYTDLNTFVRERLEYEGRKSVLDSFGQIEMGEDPFISTSVEVQVSLTGDKLPEKKTKTQYEKVSTSNNLKRHRSPESDLDKDNSHHKIERSNQETLSKPLPASQPSLPAEQSRKRSKLDHSRRIEIAQIFRNKLQKNLIQRNSPPSDDELLESEKMIRKIISHLNTEPEFFDFKALSVSKLHKLIKVILNVPELAQFHDSCSLILEAWAPRIHEIKSEKLKLKEQQTQS